MHNFSIPSTLKLWIGQITRAGVTFAYVDRKPAGLLVGKRATFLTASGGTDDEGTALAPLNFVEPYLRAIFWIRWRYRHGVHQREQYGCTHARRRSNQPSQPHLASINERLAAA